MSETVEATEMASSTMSEMPFHLRDMNLKFEFSNIHPIFSTIDKVRKEIKFIVLLAFAEWKKNLIMALCVGTVAFLLGSLLTTSLILFITYTYLLVATASQ